MKAGKTAFPKKAVLKSINSS